MLKSLKLFLRSLKRNKLISFISIGGFAISMSVILVIVTFIISEWNVNRSYPNFENIYRIKTIQGGAAIPQRLLPTLSNDIPGIKKACMYSLSGTLYRNGNEMVIGKFLATENEYFDIFSHKFVYKDNDPSIDSKGNIILTESFSERLFGKMNPVGNVIKFRNSDKKIVGVVTDAPKNSAFEFDAIINVDEAFSKSTLGFDEERFNLLKSFILVEEKADLTLISSKITGLIKDWEAFEGKELIMQPFVEVYFDKSGTDDNLKSANKDLIVMLWWVALVILLMAIFNYVNITIARGKERLAEIGIRKTIGANKRIIFKQFLLESVFVSFVSIIIALLIAIIIAPLFSKALSTKIEILTILTQSNIIEIILVTFVLVGIVAGFYPAIVASYFSPKQALQGKKVTRNSYFKSSVIAIQFLVTGILIISLIVINRQIDFVKNKDLGFDKELLVRLELNGNSAKKEHAIKSSFLSNPNIKSLSATDGTPLDIYSNSSGEIDGENSKRVENMKVLSADNEFVKTFGLKIIKGRDFLKTDKDVCLINNHLYKYLEWDNLEGKTIFGSKVIGVIENFHHENLYTQIGHLQIKSLKKRPSDLNIRMEGDIAQNMEFIKEKFNEIEPGVPCNIKFYDQWVESLYQKEEARGYAIKLFTIIAILISCLGLIGLVEHFTNQRIKEIGVRKVNGAKEAEIITLLNKDFIKWVIIAFVLACPIAYYAMNKWLQSFAYKTSLDWWIFAVSGFSSLAIALLTVSWQTIKAARKNPVEALRYE